uniref:Uncharacterized protein n=1 Tax=Helianthus annuus TaxID=4232 RepID=A0A251ST09_HELAN
MSIFKSPSKIHKKYPPHLPLCQALGNLLSLPSLPPSSGLMNLPTSSLQERRLLLPVPLLRLLKHLLEVRGRRGRLLRISKDFP